MRPSSSAKTRRRATFAGRPDRLGAPSPAPDGDQHQQAVADLADASRRRPDGRLESPAESTLARPSEFCQVGHLPAIVQSVGSRGAKAVARWVQTHLFFAFDRKRSVKTSVTQLQTESKPPLPRSSGGRVADRRALFAGPLRVVIDRAGGAVDTELCERVSRELCRFATSYALEVSSPGIDRPLVQAGALPAGRRRAGSRFAPSEPSTAGAASRAT